MDEDNIKKNEENSQELSNQDNDQTTDTKQEDHNEKVEEKSVENKLKEAEDKLLRALAETENQRRRFEKEVKDAFEFGSYNFAKESLAILDNLQRAKQAITNDEKLKVKLEPLVLKMEMWSNN